VELPQDFRDLLREFADADVRYLLVGGYAVSFHARPRFTKDIDLWLEDSEDNLKQVEAALARFGAPSSVFEALRSASGLDVVWMGNPPMRADFMKQIPGGDFSAAFPRRVQTTWDDAPISVIGLEDLLAAKRASGRPQDVLDAELLEQMQKVEK
jgi:hypothetical protein